MISSDTTNTSRLGEAVYLSVQKLTARNGTTRVRAALAGNWSSVAEHDLISRCTAFPGVELARMAPEDNAGDSPANMRAGTFDVAGLAASEERQTEWLKRIKPLLKRGGYLFIEVPSADSGMSPEGKMPGRSAIWNC